MDTSPLVIEFIEGTRLERDEARPRGLAVVRNGPPGTRVVFADGLKINLPTDQIVGDEVSEGRARVGLGGMSFEGTEQGELVFYRVRDLAPEHELSPERGRRMTLPPGRVSRVLVQGRRVFPS
jgi:hypothetical protein